MNLLKNFITILSWKQVVFKWYIYRVVPSTLSSCMDIETPLIILKLESVDTDKDLDKEKRKYNLSVIL